MNASFVIEGSTPANETSPFTDCESLVPPPADTPEGAACAAAYEMLRPAIAAVESGMLPAPAPIEAAILALGPEADRAELLGQLSRCSGAIGEALKAVGQRDPVAAQRALELARLLVTNAPTRRTRYGLADVFGVLAPTPWVCEKLQWAPGRPPMLIGYPGSGKTLAAQAAVLALITRRSIWGCPDFRPSRPMRVLHVDFDQGREATFKRYQRLMAGMGLTPDDILRARNDLASILDCSPEDIGDMLAVDDSPSELRLMSLDGLAAFETAWQRRVQGFDVVIVDSLRKVAPVLDENDSRFGEIPETLRRVSEATGVTFLLLHHTGRSKPNDKRPSTQAGRGSSAIDGAAGAQFVIEVENPDDPSPLQRRRVVHARSSADAEGGTSEPFYIAFVDGEPVEGCRPVRVEYRTSEQVKGPASRPGDKLAKTKASILAYLRRETAQRRPVAGKDALAAATGLDAKLVRPAVDQLEADGQVINRPSHEGRGAPKPRLFANMSAPQAPARSAEPQEESCKRCGGTGVLPEYAHRDGGRCFGCNGKGTKRGQAPRPEPMDSWAEADVDVDASEPPATCVDEESAAVPSGASPEAEASAPLPAASGAAPPRPPEALEHSSSSVPPCTGAPRAIKPGLRDAKEAILATLKEEPGAPGRGWMREHLRSLGHRCGAVDAAWAELLGRGRIENRGSMTRPAFYAVDSGGLAPPAPLPPLR